MEETRDNDRIPIEDGLALLAHEFRRAFAAFEGSAVKLAQVVNAVVRHVRCGGTVRLFGVGESTLITAVGAEVGSRASLESAQSRST